eukprot:TRINITY_DN42428_c0_g1_i1.p1 TRINITY_DN42428_c0_g1~~TRINITY_DN42428_c0_g1_i1.p1  ORF type:complete len:142 (-),score=28.61 TRINITY_DN42428_c0_g1_i1:79-504(-)
MRDDASPRLGASLTAEPPAPPSAFRLCSADKQQRLRPSEYREAFGVCAARGMRNHMEDEHCVELGLCGTDTHMIGVFDGHGGRRCSQAAARGLVQHARSTGLLPCELHTAIQKGFQRTEAEFIQKARRHKLQDGSLSLIHI